MFGAGGADPGSRQPGWFHGKWRRLFSDRDGFQHKDGSNSYKVSDKIHTEGAVNRIFDTGPGALKAMMEAPATRLASARLAAILPTTTH